MAGFIYADNNYNTFRVSPVVSESDGTIQTTVVFSVTVYDSTGSPVSGATAMSTAFRATKQDNAVVCTNNFAAGSFTIDAAATGPFAGMIKFTAAPLNCVLRQ